MSEPDDTIEPVLERIRRSLLDLTRRNRLLNFRSTGRQALSIVDELPGEVWRTLVEGGRTMQFLAREEAVDGAVIEDSNATVESEADGDDDDEPDLDVEAWPASGDEHESAEALPVRIELAEMEGPSEPAGRHTDRYLQTNQAGEPLQAALLHLAREARSALEERGTNILFLTLGMVDWSESGKPDRISRAPVLFIPIELRRKNVNQRHGVSMFDADIVTNPSLVEVARRLLGVDLPVAEVEPEFDVLQYLASFKAAVDAVPGWSYRDAIHLGLFSFAKLLMYQDLDPESWPADGNVRLHPMVRLLAGVPGAEPPLGAEVPDASGLDEALPPERCFQVVDADSSQQTAILAARHGANLVIQGPPGTGKSQTITNIVAECMAEGKTVLFVAEKAAALEVVRARLERAGLGDFALDLHSRTASRRLVLEELRKSLEAEPGAAVIEDPEGRELLRTRRELNDYARALAEPIGGLRISPFEAMGRAVDARGAPEAAFEIPEFFEWTEDDLDLAIERIGAVDRCLVRIGDPAQHPFRGAAVTRAGLEVRQRVEQRREEAARSIDRLEEASAALAGRIGAEVIRTFSSIVRLLDDARDVLEAPRSAGALLRNADFAPDGEPFRRWLRTGSEYQVHRERFTKAMEDDAEQVDWRETLDRRRTDGGSFVRFLKPSWHRDTRRIKGYVRSGVEIGPAEEIEVLKALVGGAVLREELVSSASRFAGQLGDLYVGPQTDWRDVHQQVEVASQLMVRQRERRVGSAAMAALFESKSRSEPRELREKVVSLLARARSDLQAFFEVLEADGAVFLDGPVEGCEVSAIAARLLDVEARAASLQDAADLNAALLAAREARLAARLGPILSLAIADEGAAYRGRLVDVFRRQFCHFYADRALSDREPLRRFRGEDHAALIDRFVAADREWIEVSRRRLRARLFARRPDFGHDAGPTSRLGILKHEMRKKRGHRPLRRLLELVGDVVQGITPCFMMSPISVAQFLTPGRMQFDVVIFDEASQVEPADAFGAIARGRQLLLIGDENQLPPTDFFGKIDSAVSDEDDAIASPTELESVLGLGAVRFPRSNQLSLRWHYRSLHHSLIEFSNQRFYEGRLRIFPSPVTDRSRLGLVSRFVDDGVYQRGAGANPREARAVAAACLEHARRSSMYSLGVGAFSQSQQRAIEDQVELMRRQEKDPRVEAFFSADREEPFFVKNLETIQGDERDVILLSVGYGPDRYGKVSMNMGPLNKDGGWRRLNVLVTRSRRRCEIFSSMRSDAIRLDATDAEGVRALKDYLATAETGALQESAVPKGGFQSPFEREVFDGLVARGFEVHSQVGIAGFHVDLAVVDPTRPGRYLCGIECDGAMYHGSPTARDRDRTRQEVLRGRGWSLLRVWSTDFFRRPAAVLQDLADAIERLQRDSTPEVDLSEPVVAADMPADPTEELPADPATGPVADPAVEPAADLTVAPAAEPAVEAVPESTSDRSPDGPSDVIPYRRAAARAAGTSDELMATRLDKLARLVRDLVEEEGPVHFEDAQRTLLSWFGARLTAKSREVFGESVGVAVSDALIAQRDPFLWPVSMEAPPVRDRAADDAVTDPDHIPPEELDAAVLMVARREMGAPEDALSQSTARVIGYPRRTPRLSSALAASIQRLVDGGSLVKDAEGFLTSSIEARP